ncbi:MAG: bifunctional 4-hydroxy-2-oxoglutarate aldolase/2-dehydro-3-deoxy-phosphogluconate aldolase [Proteobacteria bacterium]|nr:bifunctional 4-hydroxy-2-oxoglutarate aldolase/2-dehydro-3-deoxy-phosphogluconate aldolase [Pseudomonadota bacterium]
MRERQDKVRDFLAASPVVPVITIEDANHAVPLARALIAGGISAIEITLRTPAARAAAERIAKEVPEALLGIGTALTAADLEAARALGARFALSPGATPALLKAASAQDLPFIPGIGTASELMQALEYGFDVVKFFPAATMGGIPGLKALSAPFPNVRFCPTGGISEANASDWLKEPAVLAVGGSWIAPPDLIRAQNWDEIEKRARKASTLRA